ncbi:MAG: DEAD/DEAH box helicase [Calditrichia bacterium]
MKFKPPFPALSKLRSDYIRSDSAYMRGRQLFEMDMVSLLDQQKDEFTFQVEDRFEDFLVSVSLKDNTISHNCSSNSVQKCSPYAAAALIWLYERFEGEKMRRYTGQGETYTRAEMIDRVMKEREARAKSESYEILFSENVYGIHTLKSASGRVYGLTIRDFKAGSGYCTCPDYKTNKLATCKHLMFLLRDIQHKRPVEKMIETQPYPFVEIYCDPQNDYHVTYFYQGKISLGAASLLGKYFSGDKYIYPERYEELFELLTSAEDVKQILIRPEVVTRIEKHFEALSYEQLSRNTKVDFSELKVPLFPYQEEGVRFSLYKPGVIIADEMGLGKTIQAIATAVLKKQIYGLNRTLIICPASLKYQWKEEIEKATSERVEVVSGSREEREAIYRSSTAYFLITNYEAAVRDVIVLQNHAPDMIILDEAQRIKNYETKTSYAVKAIPKKHSLVLTGTPIENRLGDLYSIMNFIDPEILAPLWEFSMSHCSFDKTRHERITGYHNLQELKKRLRPWVLRRRKEDVLEQLPKLAEITVPVALHPKQQEAHARLAKSLMPLLYKKIKTGYDVQRMQRILASMRMVCDSTYLLDRQLNYSAKLAELEAILIDKLDIVSSKKKVVIFSEWKGMLRLIDNMLQSHGVRSVMLTGDVPVEKRPDLIKKFAEEEDCQIFLSSEAGGSGLNLQCADTVINMELPWNPAKKNQRIGRIHRIGQKSDRITAITLVARNSIEERIQNGIELKESLFEAVLTKNSVIDSVDFSSAGHGQFVETLQQLVKPFENAPEVESPSLVTTNKKSGELPGAEQLLLFGSDPEEHQAPAAPVQTTAETTGVADAKQLEQTLNQGMQFLRGLMSMATGQELSTDNQSIQIDKETGEVVLRFRLPKEEK